MDRSRRPTDVNEAISSMLWTPYNRTPSMTSSDTDSEKSANIFPSSSSSKNVSLNTPYFIPVNLTTQPQSPLSNMVHSFTDNFTSYQVKRVFLWNISIYLILEKNNRKKNEKKFNLTCDTQCLNPNITEMFVFTDKTSHIWLSSQSVFQWLYIYYYSTVNSTTRIHLVYSNVIENFNSANNHTIITFINIRKFNKII